MVSVVEQVDIKRVMLRIEEVEKRLDAIEEVIEHLIPEDDEEYTIAPPEKATEYGKETFLEWGKKRGLV